MKTATQQIKDIKKSIFILKGAEKLLHYNNLNGSSVNASTKDEHFEYSELAENLSDIRYKLELNLNDIESYEIFYDE